MANAIYEGDIVEVVNRAVNVKGEGVRLEYMVNGRQRVLKPGKNHIPQMHVEFAKTQNAVMGTEDPLQPASYESYIACEALGDDLSVIVLPEKANRKKERLDRSLIPAPMILSADGKTMVEGKFAEVVNRRPARSAEVERPSVHDAGGTVFSGA